MKNNFTVFELRLVLVTFVVIGANNCGKSFGIRGTDFGPVHLQDGST